MKKKKKSNERERQIAIAMFYAYWSLHSMLDETHRLWLEANATVLPRLKRYEEINLGREGIDYLYFVIEGLLVGKLEYADGKRRLRRLALPKEAILTRINLYTTKRVNYKLQALRNTVLLRIPAAALFAYKLQCREGDDLTDVLREREKKQTDKHNELLLIGNEQERCLAFEKQFKELNKLLTIQEKADFLNVSRDTVKRALNVRPKHKKENKNKADEDLK